MAHEYNRRVIKYRVSRRTGVCLQRIYYKTTFRCQHCNAVVATNNEFSKVKVDLTCDACKRLFNALFNAMPQDALQQVVNAVNNPVEIKKDPVEVAREQNRKLVKRIINLVDNGHIKPEDIILRALKTV